MDILAFEFMQNAAAAGLMAGVACGVIGSWVVVNRIVFVSGGIAHAAYGGVGLAFFLGIPVIFGILGFSFVIALIIAGVTLHERHRADAVIGALWAAGMATGILLTDLTPGYNTDLMSYLFGGILTVPRSDLPWMFLMTLTICATVAIFNNSFLAMSYDHEFARVRGVPVAVLYYLLTVMIALSVVLIVRVIGLILVIALLTIPPFIAERFSRSMTAMMLWSSLLNIGFIVTGLFLSYRFNLTSGATIIGVCVGAFFLSLAAGRVWNYIRHRRRLDPKTI